MIAATYALSGVALALTGWGFVAGVLNATTVAWRWAVNAELKPLEAAPSDHHHGRRGAA
jgi:hypothetical protein